MGTNKLPIVVGHRLLIKPWEPEEISDGGIVIATQSTLKKEAAAVKEGKIVGIGPNAWKAFDDGEPWAKVGDIVVFAKYAGKFLTISGEDYIVINDEDIQCILEET